MPDPGWADILRIHAYFPDSMDDCRICGHEQKSPWHYGTRYRNDNDGFDGNVVGSYLTRDNEPGLVLQQIGTRVVHLYRLKWLTLVDA